MAKPALKPKIKKEMGWTKESPQCGRCKYYESVKRERTEQYGNWSVERCMKCTKGDFQTMKTAWCKEFKYK